MRWEVLVMLAVVGAINLIGRIAAHRAKIKAQQAGKLPAAAGSAPARPGVPARAAEKKKPRPVPRAKQPMSGTERPKQPAAARRVAAPPPARLASATGSSPTSLGVPVPVALAPSAEAVRSMSGSIRSAAKKAAGRSGEAWDARRLRQAFVAAEVLGRPASLRGGPSTAGF